MCAHTRNYLDLSGCPGACVPVSSSYTNKRVSSRLPLTGPQSITVIDDDYVTHLKHSPLLLQTPCRRRNGGSPAERSYVTSYPIS